MQLDKCWCKGKLKKLYKDREEVEELITSCKGEVNPLLLKFINNLNSTIETVEQILKE